MLQNEIQSQQCLGALGVITDLVLLTCKVIWQSLNAVAVLGDVHDGHSRDLANASLQIPITRGHNVAAMLSMGQDTSQHCTSLNEQNPKVSSPPPPTPSISSLPLSPLTYLSDSVDETVISVGTLVGTGQTLKTRVLGHAQGHPEL